MGRVGSIGLASLVESYGLNTFVEAGTGWGMSVEDALTVPQLTDIRSIEIDNEPYWRNKFRFEGEANAFLILAHSKDRVHLYLGDSRKMLGPIAGELASTARVLWYLDAHFSGSGREVPVAMLPLSVPPTDAVPIEAELEALLNSGRDLSHDVIVIDDRCLFEADTYEAGDDPAFREALHSDVVVALEKSFTPTHVIRRSRKDTGYLIVTPNDHYVKEPRQDERLDAQWESLKENGKRLGLDYE